MKTIAMIQISDYNTDIYENINKDNIDWYVFPEEIEEEELIQEVGDLCEFYAGVVAPFEYPEHIDANKVATAIPQEKRFLENEIMKYIKPETQVVVYGKHLISLLEPLAKKGAIVAYCPNEASRLFTYIMFADLVVTVEKMSCTIISKPVIDISGRCYNTERCQVVDLFLNS